MRPVWICCLMLLLAACQESGDTADGAERPAFTPTAEEIDAFFGPLIEAAKEREAEDGAR